MTDSIFCLGIVIEDFIFLARSREQKELALVNKMTGENFGYVGYAEDLRRGFRKLAAYWRTIVFGAF